MPSESHLNRAIRGSGDSRGGWGRVATVATRQHGVVDRRQLREAELSDDAIDRAITARHLHRRHEGVYSVGHRALTRCGRFMAAVLFAGDGAVLSHCSAADLWDLRATRERKIDVIVPTHRRGDRDVAAHRGTIGSADQTTRQGIPVTTPLRTILDLAAVIPERELEAAVRQAVYHRLTTTALLAEAVHARPGRRGTKKLRNVLVHMGEAPGRTRSRLEDRFVRFLRRHALPMPELNVPLEIGGRTIEADCLWRDTKLIVELDGRDAHDSAPAFESDRARDIALMSHGWRVARVTSTRLRADGAQLANELRILTASPPRESPEPRYPRFR